MSLYWQLFAQHVCKGYIAWVSEWVLVPGVRAGGLPRGSNVTDKDILRLLLRLHLTIFSMEEEGGTSGEAIKSGNKGENFLLVV